MMASIVLDLLVQLSLRGQLREPTQNFLLPITQQIFVPLNAKDLHELGDWFPSLWTGSAPEAGKRREKLV